MNKKKVMLLAALAVVFTMWSCEKPNNTTNNTDNEEQKDDLSFSVSFKYKNRVANIKTGDNIAFDIEITDNKPEENIVYKFKPVGSDATKHQILSKDYTLRVHNKEVDNIEIKDIRRATEFIITPNVAGTFKLNFELQKYDTVQKKFIGDIVSYELIFNVVKIDFDFPTWQTGWGVWHRAFKFKISDGDREYDDYLQNKGSVRRHEYATYYDGQHKQGDFIENEWYEFRDEVTKTWAIPKLEDYPKTVTIIITQYLDNGSKNIIEYKDITVY